MQDELSTTARLAPQPTWRMRAARQRATLAVVGAAILVYLFTLVVVPQFATFTHLANLLNVAAILGIVAVGSGLVILAGGIDLSVPNVITAVGVLTSSLTAAGLPPAVTIPLALMMGAIVGAANGVAVAALRIPPLVVTLAIGSIVNGIQLVATGGTPQSAAPDVLKHIANDNLVFGLSGTTVAWGLSTTAAIILLTRTTLGRTVYAVGTNPRVAELSGLAAKRTTIVTFVISGIASAVAGLLLLGYTGISSSTAGDAYLLPAIAAVVLGGTSILGGRGNAVGIASGVFLLTAIESLLTVINIPDAARQMLEGAILLVVLALYSGHRASRGTPSRRRARLAHKQERQGIPLP